MNIEAIVKSAASFRMAIEKVKHTLGVSFVDFPRGSCGDATPLLGTYLINQGLGTFDYRLGTRGCHEDDSWFSHAWLQKDNLVVDITADQFPDITQKVIVKYDSGWHQTFDSENEHVADYRIYDQRTVSLMGQFYNKIVTELESQPLK